MNSCQKFVSKTIHVKKTIHAKKTIHVKSVTSFFDFTVLSVLFVTESPVGGTMYCHPYTGQGRDGWMVELVSG